MLKFRDFFINRTFITTITANDDENKPPQAPQTTLRIVAPQQQSNNSEAISPSLDGSKNEVHQLQKGFSLLNTNGMNDIGQKVPATVSTVATPSSSSIHSSIIREKRRPASAGTRITTKNNQQYYGRSNRRPASANSNRQRRKVQPHPPSNIITGSINYKKYNRPVKKLISKLQEYQYLPSSKSNNLRNSNVLIGRTDRNSTINYDDAVLKIYDIPIFYFPKFFHPDPSVKRQSGLIKPSINNSNVLGTSFTLPYFKVISENKDLTF